jgi:hypothetical protein
VPASRWQIAGIRGGHLGRLVPRMGRTELGGSMDGDALLGAAGSRAPSTLLTKCLCGRDKRRAGAARHHVSAPDTASWAVAAWASPCAKPRIMAIFRSFDGAC